MASVTFTKEQRTFLDRKFENMSESLVSQMRDTFKSVDNDDEEDIDHMNEITEMVNNIFTTKGFKMTKSVKPTKSDAKSTKSAKSTSDSEDDTPKPSKSKTKTRAKKSDKVKDPNKPKRAKTAFIIWSSSPEVVKQIKADNPELKHTEAVREAGKVWNQMKADDETGPYDELSLKDKERYLKAMEEYNA